MAPHPVHVTLKLLQFGPGDVRSRVVAIAWEVTKQYEDFLQFDNAGQACRNYDDVYHLHLCLAHLYLVP